MSKRIKRKSLRERGREKGKKNICHRGKLGRGQGKRSKENGDTGGRKCALVRGVVHCMIETPS